MTRIFADSNALLPPFRKQEEIKCEKSDPLASYAPMDAQMRARVRRLSDSDTLNPVDEISNEFLVKQTSDNFIKRESQNSVTMKVEAEVSFEGEFPKEGLTLETFVTLKPRQED